MEAIVKLINKEHLKRLKKPENQEVKAIICMKPMFAFSEYRTYFTASSK